MTRRVVDEELFDSMTKAIEHVAKGDEGGEVRHASWRCISAGDRDLAKKAKVKLVPVDKHGEPMEPQDKGPSQISFDGMMTDPICFRPNFDDGEAPEINVLRMSADPEPEDVLYSRPITEADLIHTAWQEGDEGPALLVLDSGETSMRYDQQRNVWFLGKDRSVGLTTRQIVETVANSEAYKRMKHGAQSAYPQRVVGGYGPVSMKQEGAD